MSGGGIRQWARRRKIEYLGREEEGGEAVITRAMKGRRKAVTNYCRLRGGKGIGRWWENRIGQIEDAECPRWEEDDTPDHTVFRCMKSIGSRMRRGEGEGSGLKKII